MIMLDVAEWIINLFMLGVTFLVWGMVMLIVALLYSMLIRCLRKSKWLRKLRNIITRKN
jgi:hypothetical protein